MKNYKQLIAGILVGITATMSITALADYIVNPNAFPVTVNGRAVNLEGYNINDRTYFQLRDIGDKVGFDVAFDNGTIMITTAASSPAPTATPTPTNKPIDVTILREVPATVIDGVSYVSKKDIKKVLDILGLTDCDFAGSHFYQGADTMGGYILTEIPCKEDNDDLIPEEYYVSTLISVIYALL
jgi:hypothetical protein